MTLRELVPFRRKGVSIKRDGDNPFDLLRYEMDTLFDDFFRGFGIEPYFGRRNSTFSPHVDVTENDKEVKVSAELPGMDDKDIEVTLNKESLTIKGEKKEDKENRGKDYYHMERSYGSFSRVVPLPVEIDSGKAEALFRKGVLTVKIPKTAKAMEEKKNITVKVE